VTPGNTSKQTWIALLGRQDRPTDGLADYCAFLGRALDPLGVELKQARVEWLENGWTRSLLQLSRESAAWRGKWVLVQYTALGWSRRGFPLGALAAMAILRRHGARPAVVFHEASRQSTGSRWIDRLRGACQDWVIRRLYRKATVAIFTIPLDEIPWLSAEEKKDKAAFIPIGGNVPEYLARRSPPPHAGDERTVIVFGVTGEPATARELEDITTAVREAAKSLRKLRLVVIGRGSTEVRDKITAALARAGVEVIVRGLLPAEEVTREFSRADVLLFVRGAVTLQRGSAIAGIACGLPVVGYQNGRISGPLSEAGIEWTSWRDRESLATGLIRVLGEPQRWMELHERNLLAQKNHFSWNRIAERYLGALTQ
jgi:glycosyltransferase involved in cell wall biosynthesis